MRVKQMTKKGAALLVSAVMMLAGLCGCSTDLTMNLKADGSGTVTQTVMIEKEYLGEDESSLDESFTYEDVKENGKEYKKGTKTVTFDRVKDIPDLDGCQIAFDENCFYMRNDSAMEVSGSTSSSVSTEEMKDLLQMSTKVTFPYEIKKTNGVIQSDKKTVVWDNDKMYDNANCWVVFSDSLLADTIAAPAFTGAKNGSYYKKDVTVKVVSDTVIDTFAVNHKNTGADNCIVSKEGKNTITCTDVNGKTAKISFVIDKTKPTVKGVASGKTYKTAKTIKYSDKYGVKSATLNGKKITSGKKVSKKGSYKLVVTDKAGNKNVVNFKIK
ncbi:MAG: hypothetical protein PUB10_05960 [Clostridiales bacterium]|nr:hypothetical protein [Clostridiales bacterium]